MTVQMTFKNVSISYDGYGFCYNIPSDFRKEIYAEWKKEIEEPCKQLKHEYDLKLKKIIELI